MVCKNNAENKKSFFKRRALLIALLCSFVFTSCGAPTVGVLALIFDIHDYYTEYKNENNIIEDDYMKIETIVDEMLADLKDWVEYKFPNKLIFNYTGPYRLLIDNDLKNSEIENIKLQKLVLKTNNNETDLSGKIEFSTWVKSSDGNSMWGGSDYDFVENGLESLNAKSHEGIITSFTIEVLDLPFNSSDEDEISVSYEISFDTPNEKNIIAKSDLTFTKGIRYEHISKMVRDGIKEQKRRTR